MAMVEMIPVTAAKRLASRGAITEAIQSGRLPVFISGADRRKRMVRVDDVRQLAEVRPLVRAQEIGTATSQSAA